MGWSTPGLGWLFRHRAVTGLAACRREPAAIPLLARVACGPDPGLAAQATRALEELQGAEESQRAVCQLWAENRAPLLGQILERCRYQVREPLALRVLTALKSGQAAGLREEPAAVAELIKALDDPDPVVVESAGRTLRELSGAAVDRFCQLWLANRQPALGALVAQCRYMATQPTEARIRSGLKAGRGEELKEEAGGMPELVRAWEDTDPVIAANARAALGDLRTVEAIEALFEQVLTSPTSAELITLIDQRRYRPADEGRWFLYLAMAGRFDEYLEEDFEFQRLRPEFRGAPEALQQRIREAILRSGDLRMNALFVTERREKLLAQLSQGDADTLVRINVRNQNWDELFSYFWILPARQILAATVALLQAGWLPADPDRAELLEKLARLITSLGPVPGLGTGCAALNRAFRTWLQEGARSDLSRKPEHELRALLADPTPPPDQIAVLGALRRQGRLTPGVLRLAGSSPHWMVRFVAAALGAPTQQVNAGGHWWFRRLAPVLDGDGYWALKPCEITRDELLELQHGLKALPDRRLAGGLNLVEIVAAHYSAHDIEVEVGARVRITEEAFEIEG